MRTPTILIGGTILFALLFWLYTSNSESIPEPPTAPSSNPADRILWEIERLKDPASGEIPIDIRSKEIAFSQQMAKAAQSFKNQAQLVWTPVGPDTLGGRTRALALDASNENTLVAGAISGGLWKSTDGGQSWTQTLNTSQLHSITTLAQDTREGKTNTWYAGTGEFRGNSASGGGAPYRGDGIYKSTDGANSWTLLPSTSTGVPQFLDQDMDYVWRIVTDASNDTEDEVYAAVYSGIYRSVDGGDSWTEVLGGGFGNHVYTDVAISSTGVVYAALSHTGTNAGIWRSEDGISWEDITPETWSSTSQRTTLGMAPSNEDVVYTITYSPGAGNNDHSLWKYTHEENENGESIGTWEDRSANIPTFGSFGNGAYSSNINYDIHITVHPEDEETVFLGGISLYRSRDGFQTTNTAWVAGVAGGSDNWSGTHHADQHIVVFSPSNPSIMYSGSDGGIHRTLDNLATDVFWTSLNDSYVTSQFYSLSIDHTSDSNPGILGGTQDNGTWIVNDPSTSIEGEKLWGGDGGFTALLNEGLLRYVSFQRGQIYRHIYNESGDRLSWALVTPSLEDNYQFIHPFTLDPSNSEIMYLPGSQRLLRNTALSSIPDFQSAEHTIGWQELTNTFITGGGVISSVEASRANPSHRVFYGTSAGRLYRLDDTHTGDPVPVDVTSTLFPVGAYASSISVHPEDADHVVVAFSNYSVQSVFSSYDGGTTWSNVSGSLEEDPSGSGSGPSVRWIEIAAIPGTDPMYFIGTSTGVYSTSLLDGLQTQWIQEGSNTIGNVVIEMLDIRHSDGLIAVGTHGRGFYQSNIPIPELDMAPGGVAGDLKLWLKADEGVTGDIQVSNWADQSLSGNDASQNTENQQPLYSPNAINFNPALNFDGNLSGDGSGDFLESADGYYDQSIFIVFKPDGTIRPKDPNAWTTAQQLIGADANGNLAEDPNDVTGIFVGDGWGGNTNELICLFSDSNDDGALYNTCYENGADSLIAGEALILSFNKRVSNDGHILYRNGLPLPVTVGAYEEMTNSPYRIGNDWDSADIATDSDSERGEGSYWFNGDIAEVILYSSRTEEEERIKIESYLAIKYGITIDHSYLSSNGTILWDLGENPAYNNEVFGIGRDDASALLQKQSMSSILSVGLDSLAENNASNENSFSQDQSFLFWGHNEGELSESEVMFGSSDAKLLNRTWYVKSTGTVDPVQIQFDLNQVDATGTEASDYWLILDTDEDPITGHRAIIEATGFESGIVTFSDITLENNDYISLVTDNPEDVQLPVELANFSALYNDGQALLSWSTRSETNNAGFEVQRHEDETDEWQTLAFIEGQGHSDEIHDYSYTDDLLNVTKPNTTYRLKQIDFDGTVAYSEEVNIQIPGPDTHTLTGYPNPFNPVATIEYHVPTDGHVAVRVFDLQGRLVETLVDESKTAGRYTVSFDGSGLASGVYIYTMASTGQTLSKTITLLK